MLESFAVHTGRFSSQHFIMRTIDRVDGNVAGGVRSPTLPKKRTAIALIPRRRKYDYITIQNTWFVSAIQRDVSIKILNKQIKKPFVSRRFDRSSFADQFCYLLVGKRSILFRATYVIKPRDFFQ